MARILVIDDNPSVRMVLDYVLTSLGHAVIACADGPEGLAAAGRQEMDLILLDVDMPRMSGLCVCAALKSDPRTRPVPVVIVTGQGTAEMIRCTREAGAVDLLPKPFSHDALKSVLERFLPRPVVE
jgi:CheY-like chemotaxis protein